MEHTVLNTLLQGGGSIITKRAMVITWEEVKKRGLDAHQVIFYHDEFDYEINPIHKQEIEDIMLSSIVFAGEYYKLRIPMEGSVKFGMNWKEIH
jgi:DNA polymerase I